MANSTTQPEAAGYISAGLKQQGVELAPQNEQVANEDWLVFRRGTRSAGVDPKSGIWIALLGGEWRCLSEKCSVSAVLEAVEFLTGVDPT